MGGRAVESAQSSLPVAALAPASASASASVLAPGTPPPPAFRQFVLKVAARCDLACDHCYVYEAADTSWRSKPRFVSTDTVRRTAERIAEHAAAHRLPAVSVVLHGGEPLLLSPDRMNGVLTELRDTIEKAGCAVDLRIDRKSVV